MPQFDRTSQSLKSPQDAAVLRAIAIFDDNEGFYGLTNAQPKDPKSASEQEKAKAEEAKRVLKEATETLASNPLSLKDYAPESVARIASKVVQLLLKEGEYTRVHEFASKVGTFSDSATTFELFSRGLIDSLSAKNKNFQAAKLFFTSCQDTLKIWPDDIVTCKELKVRESLLRGYSQSLAWIEELPHRIPQLGGTPTTPPSSNLPSLDEVTKQTKTLWENIVRGGDANSMKQNLVEYSNALRLAETLRIKAPKVREEILAAGETLQPNTFRWQWADPTVVPQNIKDITKRFVDLCKDTYADSALVIHKGKVVGFYAEDWCDESSCIMSSSKSIAATAAFMIRDEFGLAAFDKLTVCDVMKGTPGWKSWEEEPKKRSVTLAKILDHTAGMPGNGDFQRTLGTMNAPKQFNDKTNLNEGARDHELIPRAQGHEFMYSNPCAQLLDPIFSTLLRQHAKEFCKGRDDARLFGDYINERIFKKLEMRRSEVPHYNGYSDVHGGIGSCALDMGRFALMLQNKGRLPGMEEEPPLLSEETIQEMTTSSSQYSNQWWMHSDRIPKGCSSLGYLENNIHIFPDLDLILVRTQAREPGPGDYFGKLILVFNPLEKNESTPPAP